MTLRVFGLTGGIGSGKSTVAARFRARGLPVIDADELAREVVLPGRPALAEIEREFGAEVLEPSGVLDRKQLAAVVFGDERARQKLNAITHPRVRELALARFAELDASGEPLGCYEVPLLVESGLVEALRPLVVVAVPEAMQVARAAARDQSTEAEVLARIRAQMPLAEKTAIADYVIDNSGSRAETAARADAVLDAICRANGVDPARYPIGRFG
jgi:dephospho-CoA kinase